MDPKQLIESVVQGYDASDIVDHIVSEANKPYIIVSSAKDGGKGLMAKVIAALRGEGIKHGKPSKSPIPGTEILFLDSADDVRKANDIKSKIEKEHWAEYRKNKGK